MKNKEEIWESILTGEEIKAVQITAYDVKHPGGWEGVSNFKAGSWILDSGNPGKRILHDHLFKMAYQKKTRKAALPKGIHESHSAQRSQFRQDRGRAQVR